MLRVTNSIKRNFSKNVQLRRMLLHRKEVAVSAERAWEIISLPGGLTHWHPFMDKHVAESWKGVGSKDHLTYYSGFEFNREVTLWIDGVGYDLKLTENGKNEARAEYRITPLGSNRCRFKVTVHITFIEKMPFPLRWALLQFKIKPLFAGYLCLSMPGFVSCAETGEQVIRNQYGSHPVFSPEY